MKKRLVCLAMAVFCLGAASIWAAPRHSNSTVTINRDSNSGSCADQLQLFSDGRTAVYAEEVRTAPNIPLTVKASQNGGIRVTGGDGAEFSIKLCKAAIGPGDARKMLDSISLAINGGNVTVKGPANNDNDDDDNAQWSTLMIIQAPANAKLDLSATNGGISLYKLNADVVARAVNGGIGLDQVRGTVNAQAENGGVSVEGSSGNVTAHAENGGLDLKLDHSWQGGTLEASSENGGIDLELPGDFSSPLEVSTSQQTSMTCSASACQKGERTWDDDRRYFRLNAGNAVVKVKGENGGVDIENLSRDVSER